MSSYRKMDAMKPQTLRDVMVQQITEKGAYITKEMNERLAKIFNETDYIKKYKPKRLAKLMKTVQNVVIVNARNLIMNTVNDLVWSYENDQEGLPRMVFDIAVEKGRKVSYYPRFREIMYCVRKVFDAVRHFSCYNYSALIFLLESTILLYLLIVIGLI